jgi:tetratricopeptide (TPR) repeat protein
MTVSATRVRVDPAPRRSIELLLAHAHLRLGALSLARVELETMAGLGMLDTPGFVDLAEVRWRTGDLTGAGEAAHAALRTEADVPIALVIAAEAAAKLGRPSEARRLAQRAMAAATGSIDAMFAGMPRSSVWPPDADEPPPTAPTLFDHEPEPAGPTEGPEPVSGDRPVHAPATGSAAVATPPGGPVTLGFWDDDETATEGLTELPDPALELEAGRAALVAGQLDQAALRFGMALRLAPALAPAVLEATAGARGPALAMVRGDAYRLAGHELEARQSYAVVAGGGSPERRKRSRSKSKAKAAAAAAAKAAGIDRADPTEAVAPAKAVAPTDPATQPDAAPAEAAPGPPEPKAIDAPAAPTESDTAPAADAPAGAGPKPKTKPADDSGA